MTQSFWETLWQSFIKLFIHLLAIFYPKYLSKIIESIYLPRLAYVHLGSFIQTSQKQEIIQMFIQK